MADKTRNRNDAPIPDPAELRSIFGDNLRKLSSNYPSVAGLCRDLGINRTQFNRYLSGESFPRPDVLHRICSFFDVDARILLEPVETLRPSSHDLLGHPMLQEFFGDDRTTVREEVFPSGFYRFVRRSFIDEDQFVIGLVHVTRGNGYTFLRGYEPRGAIRTQGLSLNPQIREFRGLILGQDEGVMSLVTHRRSMSCSFNFLTQETSFQSNLWEGYATRTVRENVTGRRITRMVYEHLGRSLDDNRATIMETARKGGLVRQEDLPRFHATLLRLDQPFR